jgi:hypothetical protein
MECLQTVPFVHPHTVENQPPRLRDVEADFVIEFGLNGEGVDATKDRVLIAEVKSSGHPGVARLALERLHYYGRLYQDYDKQARRPILLFVAPFISHETAKLCQEAGISYVDLAGNCRLSFDTVYIERKGNPNPYTREQNRKTLFAPKAERALRVLLREPGRPWQVQQLARIADISLGTASDVKKLLQERDWLKADRDGVRLTQPVALLKEWSEQYNYRRSKAHDFFSLQAIAVTEAAIAEACSAEGIRYAFTGFSGAARLAAFVRYTKAVAYVASGIERIAADAKLKPVTRGANVTLLTPYDDGVFIDSVPINGDTVTSALQVYLDLQHAHARGEEAAEYLYEQKIKLTWGETNAS